MDRIKKLVAILLHLARGDTMIDLQYIATEHIEHYTNYNTMD